MRSQWRILLDVTIIIFVVVLVNSYGRDWDWKQHPGLLAAGAFVIFLIVVWEIRKAIVEKHASYYGMVISRDKSLVAYWFFFAITCIVAVAFGAMSVLAFKAFLQS
ncbi:MAG TPA: hypothetical protein PLN21_17715 [Gemmatales bacterium]|nr:hypothetical protein [Gemmatales bacterium]